MSNLTELFGTMVFSDSVMKTRLPHDTYVAFKKLIAEDRSLDREMANIIASAMKDWAIEKGVTHFTHWFQPMTGITAEKHDSFITDNGDGTVIMEFSGKELIKGEPDASSFPSGGLRATFEARGYTMWDPTSPAFIKDNTLCIPTAFCSYGGEALDKKTPLLKSMEALNIQSLRVLRLLGDTTTKRVTTTVGAEQEYFLIDKNQYDKRKDLICTGRTLYGAKPTKGQELDDHYFGTIKPRVQAFMKELNEELWKLGVLAKTEHNEVAPAQHELAPIYTTVNIATDQNQLTMEIMKKIAAKQNLACLLHEKPFAGVNGSGKHNNWSMSTDTGANLLDPGKNPAENIRFLLFLCAVIKAVDEHQDLLRISVASAGNDHRLGAHEAPPAIISIFLGDQLLNMLEAIENGNNYNHCSRKDMEIGVHVLPHFKQDRTDRNRTSPFAFTGNKFEFRMLGSAFSIAGPNFILNTIVAESLRQYAEELEAGADIKETALEIIRKTVANHKRIIFNGNNYSDEWVEEAERRGLLNIKSTSKALPLYTSRRNIELFTRHGIFSESEVMSRCEIVLENYCKTLHIEAVTMVEMGVREIIPAVSKYINELSNSALNRLALIPNVECEPEKTLIERLSKLNSNFYKSIEDMKDSLSRTSLYVNAVEHAEFYESVILAKMNVMRAIADEMETLTAGECWPFPTYSQLLFSVV